MAAIAGLELDTHVVHLGTMGVYGYAGEGFTIPEGYLPVKVANDEGQWPEREILYSTNPGSVYHMTKSMDQRCFNSIPVTMKSGSRTCIKASFGVRKPMKRVCIPRGSTVLITTGTTARF